MVHCICFITSLSLLSVFLWIHVQVCARRQCSLVLNTEYACHLTAAQHLFLGLFQDFLFAIRLPGLTMELYSWRGRAQPGNLGLGKLPRASKNESQAWDSLSQEELLSLGQSSPKADGGTVVLILNLELFSASV